MRLVDVFEGMILQALEDVSEPSLRAGVLEPWRSGLTAPVGAGEGPFVATHGGGTNLCKHAYQGINDHPASQAGRQCQFGSERE